MVRKNSKPYEMTISLNVLHHLGIGLYSNIPAVLSEVVANAWDADASEVNIAIDHEKDEIVVTDNGIGMNRLDINKKYLKVGYRKRDEEGATTPSGRHVMGRKGIGKLSVFSIAGLIDVYSAKEGHLSALRMDRDKIEEIIKDGKNHTYHPEPLPTKAIEIRNGTTIILRRLKKNLSRTESFLRKRLARRFSVIDSKYNFKVSINDAEITAKDRDFYSKVEFLWYFGDDSKVIIDQCHSMRDSFKLGNIVYEHKTEEHATIPYTVSGWIASVDERKSIDDASNTIVIFAHGKLVQEDILKDLGEGGIYSKYLIGEIDADFMDLDQDDDIVTSNRQSVKEDDIRYIKLKEFIWNALKQIQSRWTELRNKIGVERALENRVIKEWYGRLQGDHKKYAEKLFGKIESLKLPDKESKKELYKASMLAFERMALQNTLSTLDAIEGEQDLKMILQLFGSIDELEAAHYYQIARGRLDVIRKFEKMVPKSKERAVQEYIFDHLWLMDTSWERAASNQRMEETVNKEFAEINAKLTQEEADGRIDIRYITAAGKHIIIELKKYDRSVKIFELAEQIQKYVSSLDKCLLTKFPEEPHHIEAICILGSPPTGASPKAIEDMLKANQARYMTYDTLIHGALKNYEEYLESESKISKLIDLINQLDDSMND